MLSYFYINFKQQTRIWYFLVGLLDKHIHTQDYILRLSGREKSCKVKNEPFFLSLRVRFPLG